MTDTSRSVIGSDTTKLRFLLVYVFGVILGSGIRLASKIAPDKIVDRVIGR